MASLGAYDTFNPAQPLRHEFTTPIHDEDAPPAELNAGLLLPELGKICAQQLSVQDRAHAF